MTSKPVTVLDLIRNEKVEKRVVKLGNSGGIIVPKRWRGKKVLVILLDE